MYLDLAFRLLVFLLFPDLKCSVASCKQDQQNFREYLSQFEELILPFKISIEELFLYNRMYYDNKTEQHRKNRFKFIPKEYYGYLSPISSPNNKYRYLYRYNLSSGNTLVMIIADQVIDGDEKELWLNLIIYDSGGKIISAKPIAGYEIDVAEQLVKLGKDLTIITYNYRFLPPPHTNHSSM